MTDSHAFASRVRVHVSPDELPHASATQEPQSVRDAWDAHLQGQQREAEQEPEAEAS